MSLELKFGCVVENVQICSLKCLGFVFLKVEIVGEK